MYYRFLLVLGLTTALVGQTQAQSTTPKPSESKSQPKPKAAAKGKAATAATKASSAPQASPKAKAVLAQPKPKKATATAEPLKETNPNQRQPIRWRAPSQQGPTGLDRVWSADTGPEGTVRARFGLGWFSASNFPVDGSNNLFLGTDFSFAYTPHDLVETFLNVRGTSNTNDAGQPELLQTQGDLTLGAKVGSEVVDGISLAGALGLRLLSGLGGGGFSGGATSVDVRFLTTFDLQKTQQVPVRVYLDMGYYFENGEAITGDLPQEPSIVQEYGLQVARYDRLTLGLGLDSPFNAYFAPFMEYRVTLPILVELARRGEGTSDYSFSSVPHSLAFGLRSFPLDELALDVGVRVGLSDEPYTGVPATEPWMLMLGVAYTLDPRPKIIRTVVEKKVPAPAKPSAKPGGGLLTGRVIDAQSKQPIAGARIAYAGASELSPQVTNADGRFGGYRFPAGKVQLQATAKGYKPGNGVGVVKDGVTGKATIALKLDPAQMKGKIVVRFFNQAGRPLAGKLSFTGKAVGTMGMSTPKVPFTAELPSGRQVANITAKGYQAQARPIMVRGGETTQIRITLMKPGRKPRFASNTPRATRRVSPSSGAPRAGGVSRAGGKLAVVSLRGIRLNEKVSFAEGVDTLTERGRAVLDEVAAGLQKVIRIQRVRIAVHTSGAGSRAQALGLSNSRARAVKAYLVSQGIEAKRLQARGYGNDKPKGLSATSSGREKNERVEFGILKKR